MLADLIAGILGMVKKGRFEEAAGAIDNAYYEFLKQDASMFRVIPKKMLTSELLNRHNYTHGHLEILSELFFAEAEIQYHISNFSASLEFYEKLIYQGQDRLKEKGWLLLEIGAGQDQAIASLMTARDGFYDDLSVRADYAGHPRVIKGRRK